MKIKICGITRIEDALLCAELGVDAIGFIFYPKSKRYINPEIAKKVARNIPPFTSVVGVFVNEDIAEVNRISKLVGLNYVQLHGKESIEYIDKINSPVIKSFGVDISFDFYSTDNYSNCKILLDVKDEIEYGGTGKSFDWSLIPKELRSKVIIAGGISKDNIKLIYDLINPAAVDLSSSVEISPGKKDKTKIQEVMKLINEIKLKEYE